ncbi:YHS domain-containing (seleno)protein [Roseobacter sinensis]|uniref:YHS domain protein n=1 Tax=Roseobacter sinensis TaxID=2931391 RepID=A0ABT3BD99_9RHOB|nr:YHS domain-containing (seleno)protein [Roseobacter sp. WL0113]MCV3271551.1 YHS domain protein [Roseobacter sp. WL0113]
MIRKLVAAFAAAVTLALTSLPATAGNQLAVAIGGYDTVSYHQDGPKPGEARINHFWNGAIWYFSSTENRDAFAADPARYAPAYDGYCSWAASQNYKAPGDPNVWQIVDDVLYVQVHPRAQELWQADIPAHIDAGNENWPRIHPF